MKIKKSDVLMGIGFCLEIAFFVIGGISMLINPWIGFGFIVVGIGTGLMVGKRIEKDAIKKYKRGEII